MKRNGFPSNSIEFSTKKNLFFRLQCIKFCQDFQIDISNFIEWFRYVCAYILILLIENNLCIVPWIGKRRRDIRWSRFRWWWWFDISSAQWWTAGWCFRRRWMSWNGLRTIGHFCRLNRRRQRIRIFRREKISIQILVQVQFHCKSHIYVMSHVMLFKYFESVVSISMKFWNYRS